jgi:hypothetical protein
MPESGPDSLCLCGSISESGTRSGHPRITQTTRPVAPLGRRVSPSIGPEVLAADAMSDRATEANVDVRTDSSGARKVLLVPLCLGGETRTPTSTIAFSSASDSVLHCTSHCTSESVGQRSVHCVTHCVINCVLHSTLTSTLTCIDHCTAKRSRNCSRHRTRKRTRHCSAQCTTHFTAHCTSQCTDHCSFKLTLQCSPQCSLLSDPYPWFSALAVVPNRRIIR